MAENLYIDTDTVVTVSALTNTSDDSYVNNGTATMSLFKLAAQQRVQILTPNVVATAGTWTLTYQGETTEAIEWDANLWEIQAALDQLDGVIEGDIVVTGVTLNTASPKLAFEFAESFTDVPAITFNFSSLTGPTNALSTMFKKTKNLFKGAVTDKGTGKVGLPVIRHDCNLAGGDYIRIEGTKNYDGEYTVDAATEEDEIVVTATYVAETFTGRETLYIGIVNGTNLSLTYVATSDGDYEGLLPNNLKGLIENELIDTSRGTVEVGVYWLFVKSTDPDPTPDVQRVKRIEYKAKWDS
jgi:hypothetical protein